MREAAGDCCGERLHWLVAAATEGDRAWQLLRCRVCERVHGRGWTPSADGATADLCRRLDRALEQAVADAYGAGAMPAPPGTPGDPELRDVNPRDADAGTDGGTTALPDGLERCPVCDECRGTCVVDTVFTNGAPVQVTCLCDGILCPRCGMNQMHRPISNRYDEIERKVLHVPYFILWAGCKECRQVRNSSDYHEA